VALLAASLPAASTEDVTPIRHPLVSESARLILASRPQDPVDAVLRDLETYSEIVCDDLTCVRTSGVRQADREVTRAPAVHVPGAAVRTVHPEVQGWLDDPLTAPPEADLALAMDRRRWKEPASVPQAQRLAMLEGTATTSADLAQIRADVVARWSSSGAAAMAPTLVGVEALGATVTSSSPLAGTIRARVPTAALPAILAAHPEILTVEPAPVMADDAGYAITVEDAVDGVEAADLLQANFFHERGYFGVPDESIGIVEPEADELRNLHVSFEDAFGNSRVSICGGTDPEICSFVDYDDGYEHPTKVTSILLSDLTLGQDANYTNPTEREQRSGVAREAYGIAMTSSDLGRVADMFSPGPGVYLVNHSASGDPAPSSCYGIGTSSQTWDSMYEAGIALFNSAGNNDHADPTACTVGQPASAMGVMAVGAYRIQFPPNSDEELSPATARGGGGATTSTTSRTLIGLLAPTGWLYRAEADQTADPEYKETGRFGITSASSPAATGAAALFRDWYKDEVDDAIDEPGLLYANLLLMGDRLSQTGGRLSSGFDNVSGAGVLRLRMFDADGLDNPAAHATGSVCVGDGQTVNVPFNSGTALGADVDYVKVVAWWYDYDYDGRSAGDPFNTVFLRLEKQVSGSWVQQVASNNTDNRQRVFADSGVGGSPWRFRLYGNAIETDADYGCGVDSVLVYWASVWEDNDRDDGGDLTDLVRPEP
jgi:hypothetical protein